MQTTINNPTGAPIQAYWNAQADNLGWYFINGKQIGQSTNWSTMNKYPITLQPGNNVIDTTALNQGNGVGPYYGPNPTDTADEITGVGGNTVYSATGNGSWRMVAGPPTTPTNLPASRTNCYTTSCAVP
ncbi:hypothetical protein HAP94_07065 [Acidithiobacillus ferrivorans]|nr:hypothetical protein [Acidithiobacillus ferrivorans]